MAVFGDLNECSIIGNITEDIEVRTTPNGTSVTNFSVATNRSYKAGDEWKDETTFHNLVVWGNDADYLSQRAKKGTRVYATGRIQNRSWEGQDGQKRYRTEIVVSRILLLDRYERGASDGSSTKSADLPSQSASPAEDTIDPDDLPF
jgi:single-strand DNA-binding protein